MSFFDKANQIQVITAELKQLEGKLSDIKQLLADKNSQYDALNSGFEEYKKKQDKELQKAKQELIQLNKQLEKEKDAIKQQQQIREVNEEKEKKRKEELLKEQEKIVKSIKEKSKEVETLAQEIVDHQEVLNEVMEEMKSTMKVNIELRNKNEKLLDQITDSERFIKNLVIREQILSQREARLNKKLCQDSK